MTTMREVARHAGVSLATVSYVANHGPKHVSPDLRERVLRAMAALGYKPARRGRARRHPLLIGVIVPDMTNMFFSRAIGAAMALLQSQGHLMIAGSSNGDADREAELLATFVRLQVHGLLVTPTRQTPGQLEHLSAEGLPVVLLDWDSNGTSLNRVALDNHRSAYQATRLLIEGGHRRIALVGGPVSASSAQERLRGYRDALAAAALVDLEDIHSGPYTHEYGRAATLDLLSRPDPPDAIFSGGVLLTLGVLQALRERHVRWPEDIALVGYGDARWASTLVPPLTTIEQPVEQLGEMAVKMLLASIERHVVTRQRIVLESHLVARESHHAVLSPQSSVLK
jgi:LacI family transcriptional regulator, galactose operon repressor